MKKWSRLLQATEGRNMCRLWLVRIYPLRRNVLPAGTLDTWGRQIPSCTHQWWSLLSLHRWCGWCNLVSYTRRAGAVVRWTAFVEYLSTGPAIRRQCVGLPFIAGLRRCIPSGPHELQTPRISTSFRGVVADVLCPWLNSFFFQGAVVGRRPYPVTVDL